MTVGGLWIYGDWRHVATGCTALVCCEQYKAETVTVEVTLMVTLLLQASEMRFFVQLCSS